MDYRRTLQNDANAVTGTALRRAQSAQIHSPCLRLADAISE